MIGHSLLLFIHPSNIEGVYKQLESKILEVKETGTSQRCQFICQVKEQQRSHIENATYQTMKFTGYMSSTNQRRCLEQECSSLGFVLKAYVQPLQTQIYKEMSLTDAIQDEYITRHSPDGTIIFADHRLSTITGHLPHEVCGNSAYKYISSDNTLMTMFAHKMMFNNGRGLIVYQLQTRNNDYVFLRTTGYVQYQSSSSEIEYFTCINKLLTDEEGSKELEKFNEQFSPHISQTTASSLYEIISSPQETKGLSPMSTHSQDGLPSPSDKRTDNAELLHKISVLTPKSLVPNNICSGSSVKPMIEKADTTTGIKEPLSCPVNTNVMPVNNIKSKWGNDWNGDKVIELTEYPQHNILPNRKTKVYGETNKDVKKRIKTVCDVENSYCNGMEGNDSDAMEIESAYCTDLFLNHEEKQAYYNPLDAYNSMFHLNFPQLQ